ncbi:MAG: hypothetical protein KH452_13600 [Clostridiales bacterium]|nr:hypothetical protein [Clostridiales bacterium]
MRNRRSFVKESWIFAGLLALFFLLFAWRQFYGFNKNDEIFYISTVYRFFQGDAMLVDEWNNVQLFAFITYPLYCLVRLFHPSNDGIVLIFRIAYLVFQAGTAVYCYCRMKRFGWVRILPAVFYFMTTPYNINSLSYNTLALGFVLLTLVTLASAEEWKITDCILCGVFTAGAVLANPYAVLLFIGYGMACVCSTVSDKRRKRKTPAVLSLRNYIWMGIGAFLIFVLFVIFVFSRGSLEEILESFTYIVMDSERQKSFWEKFAKYFIRIHRYYRLLVYTTGILMLLWIADRRKKIASSIYLAVDVAATVPYIIYYGFFWEMVGINYMLVPLAFPGVIAYMVSKERDKRLFFGWYVPGLLYTLLAHFATNTGILTVSASYMIAGAASVLLIWQVVKEQGNIRWLGILAGVLMLVQLLGCFWQRMVYVWGDEHLEYLEYELTEGPMKGIHTSAENAQLYADVLQDMQELGLTEDDKLFVIGIAPWMYLNTEAECGAYSTWETLETDPLISVYYEIRPEKLPTVIYCYEYEQEILETEFAQNFINMGYEPTAMRRGIVLERR